MTVGTTRDSDTAIQEIIAKQEKLAEAAGMNVLEYMAQAEGGILRETILKIVRHARTHPNECPADCAFNASLGRLEKKYSVS